jgi:hypothetical protein
VCSQNAARSTPCFLGEEHALDGVRLELVALQLSFPLEWTECGYELVLCDECRAADWYVIDPRIVGMQMAHVLPTGDSKCVRCGGEGHWEQTPVRHVAEEKRRPLLVTATGGRIAAAICRRCGHTVMRAGDFDTDEAEVLDLPPPFVGGPYR